MAISLLNNKQENRCLSYIESDLNNHGIKSGEGHTLTNETIAKINNIFRLSGAANSLVINQLLISLGNKLSKKSIEYQTLETGLFVLLDWIYFIRQ